MARLKSAWDKLSMNERALFIRLGLLHGLSDLKDIKDTYNLYSSGGNLSHKKSGEELGESQDLLNKQNISILDPIRQKLYRHIYPSEYQDALQRIVGALMGKDDVLHTAVLNDGSEYANTWDPIQAEKKQYLQTGAFANEQMKYRDDIFATYLGIPQSERRQFEGRISLLPSLYKPTKNTKGINTPYYTFPNKYIPWDNIIKEALGVGSIDMFDNNVTNDTYALYPLITNQNTTVGSGSLYNALGEYTVGLGYDANKGLYVSMYDLWDLDPFGKGNSEILRFKNEGKADASFGIGTPVLIYDRMYLDDYYGLTGNERGSYYLPEVTVTDNKYGPVEVGGVTIYDERTNKKSTGGPLYPFSFEKNPSLKTPVVRYDEGGHLFGFGDWLTNLFSPTATTHPVSKEPAPLDLGELATRQAYAESKFDSNAVSPANAIGLFLVTPNTLAYYNSKTGNTFTTQDLYDDTINQLVRDWYMNDLMNRPWNTKNNPSDSVQYAKSLGAYNWGPTNLVDTLNKAKADGVDIYNSWDWLAYLPTETRDYINFVLRNLNNSAHRNNIMYNRSTDKYLSKVSAIKSNK